MASKTAVNDLTKALEKVTLAESKVADTPKTPDTSSKASRTPDAPQKAKKKRYPAYLSLELSGDTTVALRQLIYDNCSDDVKDYSSYTTKRGEDDKAHLTVLFPRGVSKSKYKAICDALEDMEGSSLELSIEGCVVDSSAIAMVAKVPALTSVAELTEVQPDQEHYHVTMMLADGVKPVYCKGLVAGRAEDGAESKTYKFSSDTPVYGKLTFIHYGGH